MINYSYYTISSMKKNKKYALLIRKLRPYDLFYHILTRKKVISHFYICSPSSENVLQAVIFTETISPLCAVVRLKFTSLLVSV